MFLFMAAIGIVSFAFVAAVITLVLMDHRAREVIQQLPTNSQGKR